MRYKAQTQAVRSPISREATQDLGAPAESVVPMETTDATTVAGAESDRQAILSMSSASGADLQTIMAELLILRQMIESGLRQISELPTVVSKIADKPQLAVEGLSSSVTEGSGEGAKHSITEQETNDET